MNRYNLIHIYPKNRAEIGEILARFGTEEAEFENLLHKAQFLLLFVQELPWKAAVKLKEEFRSCGGDVLLENKGGASPPPRTNALLMGKNGEYMELMQRLKEQPYGLKRLSVEIGELLQKEKGHGRILEIGLPHGAPPLIIGKKTLIMGILNVTPDSFSDGGRYNRLDKAIAHAEELVEQGADIIDVGGESTRPGFEKVAEDEELKRVIPVIEELSKRISLPISIDTYKAAVARRAIEAGAHIINDVWGGKGDPHMPVVVAETKAPVVLMHNRKGRNYRDLIPDVLNDLRVSIDLILAAGGKEEQIIIDPGIGFAKDYEENLTVMHHLREFSSLGYPLLLGTSRKSMIGKTLDLPTDERVEGTIATVVYGIEQGAEIVRVHDVKEVARAVRMTDAMVRRGWRHG